MKEKWIIWGTGLVADYLYEYLMRKDCWDSVSLVVDVDEKKWNTIWHDRIIQNPEKVKKADFDKLIIAVAEWRPIYWNLINKWELDRKRIDNHFFLQRQELLNSYSQVAVSEKDLIKYLQYIKEHPMDVFNDDFVDKYSAEQAEAKWDEEKNLFFVMDEGKRMYFSKKFDTKRKAELYYSQLRKEQDISSPHRYCNAEFNVSEGDIVLDAGVAEGNFALSIIDKVKKIYLVESDKDWIEALEYTFESYREKVEIVQGFLSDQDTDETVTIDHIIGKNRLDFIKMDIEGAEISAIKGGKRTFQNNTLKVAACSYHQTDDYNKIVQLLKEYGYETRTTAGYMVFLILDNYLETEVPKLVRGVVQAQRKSGMAV